MTGLDIVSSALREIGVINAVDPASAEDAALGLDKLNRILDNWNAERPAVYCEAAAVYTIVPATTPQTIGPSPALWVTTQRPVSVSAANLWSGTTRTPLRIRDRAWWVALSAPGTSGSPTDLYYEPAWPAGEVYLYPTPSAADTVELWSRVVLAAMDLGTDLTLPPGYQDALTLTLAEALAPAFHADLSPIVVRGAMQARARVWAANSRSPRISTCDAGMPGGGRGFFDIRAGQ